MSLGALTDPIAVSLIGGGLVTALLHAVLPTHWLPFVLVARAQGWSATRLSIVTAMAALAHIASTALVGLLIVGAGLALETWVEGLAPRVAAVFLAGFGLFYLLRAVRQPAFAGAAAALNDAPEPSRDRAAALGLIALLAISPGEVLLPLYLTAADQGMGVIAALTGALALGTLAGMLGLVLIARAGAEAFRLERWARYERAILGFALLGLALFVALRGH
ncbi:hypothetical protein [Brevundimonas balnearis]|uniref:Translocator protein, LysE family n=1 Tax=Brevundimonas balnearis TaxID=1572858 RepID=A0ABV6R1Q4_9CAUL